MNVSGVSLSRSIEHWRDTNKYVVNFTKPAKEIGPLELVKGGAAKAPQGPRYTSLVRIQATKDLDGVF